MEISATEIDLLSRRISSSITDYVVSSVYSIEKGSLLRLHHSTKPEKLIAIASFATWLTTKNLALSEATSFVSDLREIVERERLLSVERSGNERISKFSFQARDGERKNLYAEFFAGGNQILTDDGSEDNIVAVANPQRFRHRVLSPGEKYTLPPSRGVPLEQITLQVLEKVRIISAKGMPSSEPDAGISAIRWFGRNVGTSRKFVEEIFYRAEVDPQHEASDLSKEHLASLVRACTSLLKDMELSDFGYLLVPDEKASGVEQHDHYLDVDVSPIIPHSWKILEEESLAKVVQFPSFSDALDEAQVQSLIQEGRRKVSIEARAKAAELDSAIRKQGALLEKNEMTSKALRSFGNEIMSIANPEITDMLLQKLVELEIIGIDDASGRQLRFSNEPRAFLSQFNARALASRLFDEAKRLEESNRRIESVRAELTSQKEELDAQSTSKEDKAERKLVIERRPREWYERYRWFISSNGKLVIGGRDSTSNSVIVNKYLEQRDFVFHADLYGSPFFVVKNHDKEEENAPTDEIALEVGHATVSFSRAWKDELGSADAYWVYPSQIKKSAPSGEYLPRGSFFIEGKKNYLKHLKVALCVGLMKADKLPREHGESKRLDLPADRMEIYSDVSSTQSEENSPEIPKQMQTPQQILVVCGPEKSLSHYCEAMVRIAPGREKGSLFARRVKQLLVGKIKDQALKDIAKHVTVDEIIRVLPSGYYKLVIDKQNR